MNQTKLISFNELDLYFDEQDINDELCNADIQDTIHGIVDCIDIPEVSTVTQMATRYN